MAITINKKVINGLVSTYAEDKDLVALIGSSGYLEIALKNGNTAIFLDAKVGNEVVIRLYS